MVCLGSWVAASIEAPARSDIRSHGMSAPQTTSRRSMRNTTASSCSRTSSQLAHSSSSELAHVGSSKAHVGPSAVDVRSGGGESGGSTIRALSIPLAAKRSFTKRMSGVTAPRNSWTMKSGKAHNCSRPRTSSSALLALASAVLASASAVRLFVPPVPDPFHEGHERWRNAFKPSVPPRPVSALVISSVNEPKRMSTTCHGAGLQSARVPRRRALAPSSRPRSRCRRPVGTR